MDWENPKTYDEKLHYVMAHAFGEKEAKYADKYAVREYIEECGWGELLPEIYGMWNSTKEIKLENLPNKFVLKTNHACGENYYLLCKDKALVDWQKEFKRFEKALKKSFWKHNFEYHYKYITPCVYAEQYLENEGQERMIDFKVHCFNGVPHSILVCSDRENVLKKDYYDVNWNYLDVVPEHERSTKRMERPKGLETMLKAAAELSKPFPAARIDFYEVGDKVYFGEITLTPGAGNLFYINEKYQKIMGDLFVLPKDKTRFAEK